MRKQLVTGPVNPVLELDEVKEYGNINMTEDDARITALLQPAINYVQDYTGKALIDSTYDIYYNGYELRNRMPLSTLNVTSIDTFNTYDNDNTATLVDSTDYRLTGDQQTWAVFNNGFTNVGITRQIDAAIVRVTAGYGATKTDINDNIRTAMKIIVMHWYRFNGAVADSDLKNIPHTVKTLLAPYTNTWNFVN